MQAILLFRSVAACKTPSEFCKAVGANCFSPPMRLEVVVENHVEPSILAKHEADGLTFAGNAAAEAANPPRRYLPSEDLTSDDSAAEPSANLLLELLLLFDLFLQLFGFRLQVLVVGLESRLDGLHGLCDEDLLDVGQIQMRAVE